MSARLHKCNAQVIATKVGGLSEVRPCGKMASVKSRRGKGYLCVDHAFAEQQEQPQPRSTRNG